MAAVEVCVVVWLALGVVAGLLGVAWSGSGAVLGRLGKVYPPPLTLDGMQLQAFKAGIWIGIGPTPTNH
jgi:hypothetical protein